MWHSFTLWWSSMSSEKGQTQMKYRLQNCMEFIPISYLLISLNFNEQSHWAPFTVKVRNEPSNLINRYAKNTSNRSLESVRDNGIIRIQCEPKIRNERNPLSRWILDIYKFSSASEPIENMVIDPDFCDNRDYQAHLERISDFLLVGEGVWWHREEDTGDFVFHDGDGE